MMDEDHVGDGRTPRRRGSPPAHLPPRATIGEVADAAGVSRATVSRVMNGHSSVDPALAARVKEAAAALGYEPNGTAQSLARGRTNLVGIVVPDLENPVFQAILRGLSTAAGERDHRVLIADSHERSDEEPILAREVRRRCDALVMCAPRMSDEALIGVTPGLYPVTLVNRRVKHLDVPTVSIDHASGLRAIVHHLTTLGHRNVAYLGGPAMSAANRERLDALQATAEGRFELLEVVAGSRFADGFDAIDRILAGGITAVIGYNDLVAYGALARLHDLGIAVPGDVSITGFDDIPFARHANPSLTTVAIPQEELGREAWNRVWAALAGEPPLADSRFTPQLIVRSSTGPAPR